MGRKILVADDEPNIVVALEFLLRSNGYEVLVARNGEEVLERIAQDRPDLVLLDVMMPMVSGFDVCRRIRQGSGGERIRIVMLSARGREAEVSRGLAAGADLYVVKPFSTGALLAQIDALLAPG